MANKRIRSVSDESTDLDSNARHCVALVVPWFHGASFVQKFIAALSTQTRYPDVVVFIDSSPDEETTKQLRGIGFDSVRIAPESFDHGGTRNFGVSLAKRAGADIVVLMTQDAILADERSIERLLLPFEDLSVSAAFGRQLPRPEASILERANRAVRYPANAYVANQADGNRRYFLSNAFAAYRIQALEAVGGFPEPTIFGEDAVASMRLQRNGFEVVYQADAMVIHSHEVRLLVELRRFFDIGVTSRQPAVPREWSSRSDGARSTLLEWREAHRLGGAASFARAVVITGARAIGLTLGRSRFVPTRLGRRLAYSKAAYLRVLAEKSEPAE